MGRIMLLGKLLDDGIIDENKPHHLLGCSLPQEFKYYGDYEWIDSLDTSNPIVAGIKNVRYGTDGLLEKPSVKLFELIEENLSTSARVRIAKNVKSFRKITNG